jgi:hypothetical protein
VGIGQTPTGNAVAPQTTWPAPASDIGQSATAVRWAGRVAHGLG